MKIFNTLTRRKEEFVPLEEGKVKMYVCGPTVYNLIHIGNARPMIIFDTVRRYMEYKGYEVNYVSNFTDVDDKIIKKAIEEGVSAEEISTRYIKECKKDMADMNVKPATTAPQATQEIQGMIDMIQTLIDKGYAYPAADGTVYFRVKKFKEYGKLSHKNLDDLQSGFRSLKVSGEDQKEDPLDFVLWKPKKEGEPSWPSPWCDGRPGWHIECSVMSKKYLGEEIDIHAGGEDLIFPHHENEIAQSECCNGKIFARYWMHNGFLNIDNRKMSKSLGNFFTVREISEKYICELQQMLMDDDCWLPYCKTKISELTKSATITSTGEDAELLLNGIERHYGDDKNCWSGKIGDTVTFSFESEKAINEVRFVFNSDLNRETTGAGKYIPEKMNTCNVHKNAPALNVPKTLVKDMKIEIKNADDKWQEIDGIKENHQRLVKIKIGKTTKAIRFTLTSTNGNEIADIYSIDLR